MSLSCTDPHKAGEEEGHGGKVFCIPKTGKEGQKQRFPMAKEDPQPALLYLHLLPLGSCQFCPNPYTSSQSGFNQDPSSSTFKVCSYGDFVLSQY